MTKTTIIGAGMAGLLAGCILRSDCEAIFEAQEQIPNNHSALLRFRSPVVGDVIGLPFKNVKVMKTVAPWRNPLADALAYANKCTGTYTLRSSLTAKSELEDRYVAPPDLIQKMVERCQCEILCGKTIMFNGNKEMKPFISTVPMPQLMSMLYYDGERPQFQYVHGANINARLPGVNAYATLYVPNPDIEFNRVSLTGDRLTIEFSNIDAAAVTFDANRHIQQALSMMGMKKMDLINVDVTDQKYAKILPVEEALRKRFILWATEKFNVYSLGRFATWRPGLLLDDVVNDVRVIQNIIAHGNYDQRKR